MRDFSEKYRSVTYFGLWAEEVADLHGQHDAWAIVVRAVKNTIEEDVRCSDLEDALGYLAKDVTRKRPFTDFNDALGIKEPQLRYAMLKDAAERIARVLGD